MTTTVNQLLNSKDDEIFTVSPETLVIDAIKMIDEKKVGALLVTGKNNDLKGIVSERDLAFRVIPKNLNPKKITVSEIMTKNVETISPKKTTHDAIHIMKSRGFRHLPVIENKKIIGILSMRDLYDYAHNELQDSLKKHQEFMFGTGYGS